MIKPKKIIPKIPEVKDTIPEATRVNQVKSEVARQAAAPETQKITHYAAGSERRQKGVFANIITPENPQGVDVTKEEYDLIQGFGRGGKVTPNVQKLRGERDYMLSPEYKKDLIKAEVEREAKGAPVPDEAKQLITGNESIDINKTLFDRENLKVAKSNVATIIDRIRVGIGGKKPLAVQQAEQSFTDAASLLEQDAKLVEVGAKSFTEAWYNVNLAESALSRLEAQNKGMGKENLRYWQDSGAELATQIELEKSRLLNLRRGLINSEVVRRTGGQ